MTKLSKRAVTAIDVLSAGGKFLSRLERNSYTGREQFAHRLLNSNHRVVVGIGHSTYHEIKHMLIPAGGNTSVSSYYTLRAGWAG